MDREDFLNAIGIADAIEMLDDKLRYLTGASHCEGQLKDLDSVYELLLKYSHEYYRSEKTEELFYRIIADREKSPEERMNILINGTVRYDENDNVVDMTIAK